MSTTKLTLDQAVELFQKVGVPVAIVDNPEEADQDVNLEDLVPTPTNNGFTQEDIDKAVQANTGRINGAFRSSMAKVLGIRISDLEGKDALEIANMVKDTYGSRYTAKEQELAGQVEELTRQLNAKDEEFAGKFQSLESEWKNKMYDRDITEHFKNELNKIPRSSGDLAKQSSLLYHDIRQKYDVRYDEVSGAPRYYAKGTDELVMDGKNPLTTEKLAKAFVTELGLEVKDTSNITPADVVANQLPNYQPGVVSMPGMGVPANANVAPELAGLVAAAQQGGI